MIKLKNLTIRNFLSIGNVTQAINFDGDNLVLVLGENLDLGGNDNRNGTGKSSCLNALSYALYGSALTSIKKDNLINKTNGKNMMVTLEFEKDGTTYRIERGRKPAVFKYIVNGKSIESGDGEDGTDEAQGENRLTQAAIENELCMSHNMFKNIVGLNTFSTPFLSMKSGEQRELIEQLLGITKLSEKAELLKVLVKDTKDLIKEEEYRIKALKDSNSKIEENILMLGRKSVVWEADHEKSIADRSDELEKLYHLNIDSEVEAQLLLTDILSKESQERAYLRELSVHEKEAVRLEKAYLEVHRKFNAVGESKCPTCEQNIDGHNHDKFKKEFSQQLEDLENLIDEQNITMNEVRGKISGLNIPARPTVFYRSLQEAYDHRTKTDAAVYALEKELSNVNPYVEQIKLLGDNLKDVDFAEMNTLCDLRDHQEFLMKLLTSKDSFIRKKIIDQNLNYLNKRLSHYLGKIGLPHEVKFHSNLEVEITEHGRDLDFDNLSRGEKTRLILSLSWAFRDVFESLNTKINLTFVDELLDSGLDSSGMENSLAVLKHMIHEGGRCIFLVSHREELFGRVDNILKVVKEGGFTSIEMQ